MDHVCLTRRCGLCQFRFRRGDHLIAVRDGKKSRPFLFLPSPEIRDEALRIRYNVCTAPCTHPDDRVVGCHVSCLDILDPAPLDRFLDISGYSFEPLPCQERARCRWLRDEVTSKLEESLPLPAELRREISRHLLREYAVTITRPLLNRPRVFSVSVTKLALATRHHVVFEGERYLSALSIDPDGSDDQGTPKVLYVSEDHRGIQGIVFATSTDTPKVDCPPGVWWKAISIQNSDGIVEFHSDGVKLRHLTYKDDLGAKPTLDAPSFSTPQHPEKPFRVYPFYRFYCPAPPRIRVLRYNHPEMTGLSVRCDPAPVALYVHTPGDDLSFYKSTTDYSVWIHVPLEPGERIAGLWMRGRCNLHHHMALAFTTNLGRTQLLGSQTTPVLSVYPWILLDIPGGEPSHLYVDSHPKGISHISFDSPAPAQTGISPLVLPTPLSSHPNTRSLEGFLWSQASAEDVVEVTPCRRAATARSEIIGLSFRYADGRTACVGQIRLDSLDPPLSVEPSQRLCLRFEKTEQMCAYVAEAVLSAENPDMTTGMWFQVSWTGTLEWWYNYRQCQVWQDGRQSVKMRT